ncbi:MAG TPA: tetratricopeptide repeat protein, partial [Candidatus Krumholzibacteria bacterium]|nr:tetratricopeptide repeat protein [Candidatus Krumholzibacteria bacterium]
DEIAGMQKKLIKGEFIERKKERFWIPLVVALVALLGDALVSTRATRRKSARWLHTGATASVIITVLALLAPVPARAAESVDRGKVRSANKLYKKGDYKESYRMYREALGDTAKPASDAPGVYYNGGNALYMQNQFDQALESYARSYSPDSALTGKMLYNRGNTLLRSGRFDQAIESYLQALQYLPDDEDARHNLELALAAQEQQQQQQQRQQSGDQNQKQQQQQQQQQQQGDSQGDSTSTQPPQNQNQPQRPDSSRAQQQPPPPDSTMQAPQPDSTRSPLSQEEMQKLSPEDAARILQALQEREQELQKERRKAAFRRTKRAGKDW